VLSRRRHRHVLQVIASARVDPSDKPMQP